MSIDKIKHRARYAGWGKFSPEGTPTVEVWAAVSADFEALFNHIEAQQAAIEWCLENGARRCEYGGVQLIEGVGADLEVPAEFAEIVKAVKP